MFVLRPLMSVMTAFPFVSTAGAIPPKITTAEIATTATIATKIPIILSKIKTSDFSK